MPRYFLLALAAVAIVTLLPVPADAKIVVGTKVLWRDQAAPLTEGDQTICTCGDLHWPCTVEKVAGTSLWIGDTKFHGWVHEEAVMTIEEAIRFRTEELRRHENVLTYINRGAARFCNKEYDLAIKDYNAAVRLAPANGDCYFNRGESWLAKKAYPEAVADFTKAIYLNSNPAKNYEVYRLRADAYEKQGDLDAAAADRRRAQRLKWSLR